MNEESVMLFRLCSALTAPICVNKTMNQDNLRQMNNDFPGPILPEVPRESRCNATASPWYRRKDGARLIITPNEELRRDML